MRLYRFQNEASTVIANKFQEYMKNPLFRTQDELVPFFQNLSAITGAGKTLILADTIAQMRMQLPAEPIVLWISKGKVVVSQTYANLSAGKYTEFIPGFTVLPLLDCKQEHIENEDTALLLVATAGKFNQKDMDKGDRMVFRENLDNADTSLWKLLAERSLSSKINRPLFIVYDEGHNLSDQQTELLLKLNPNAILSASATMRISAKLDTMVKQRFRTDKNWTETDFSVAVKSSDVVKSGLIKKHIAFNGYVSPMELAVDELLSDYKNMCEYINDNSIVIQPKAIYVSRTNIVAETGEKDNYLLPFEQRQSIPIKIWKYLTGKHGINPRDIAVYCDLKVDARFPVPEDFHLFSGGENDYDSFIAGEFHHIIFNLSLQEGWDDPECYFAYIDKDMGSKDQVTQVLGRVLRQPNSQHYSYQDLNTAHIYVHSDSKSVIDEAIKEIQAKLSSESPEITLSVSRGKSSGKNNAKIASRKNMKLPETAIIADNAKEPIRAIIDRMPDYRNDAENTVGMGSKIKVLQTIGIDGKQKPQWIESKHTNKITARWLFKRELQEYFDKVENLCDTEKPLFDALIEYSSIAADIVREWAEKVVDAYIEHSIIVLNSASTKPVFDMYVDPQGSHSFVNSLHEKYSDFNQFELEFAQELDKAKKTWFRNPKQGCFSIPLLDKGGTNNFNPDFIVWVNKTIIAVDTKGDHLIVGDAHRKLFTLEKRGNGADLVIKLVTKGEWTLAINKIKDDGYTVWSLKNGKIIPNYSVSLKDCIHECLTVN